MIVRYQSANGVTHWIECHTLTRIGRVTGVGETDSHGVTELTLEESLWGDGRIGDYQRPIVGEYLYEGMRDKTNVDPKWFSSNTTLVQFAAAEIQFEGYQGSAE